MPAPLTNLPKQISAPVSRSRVVDVVERISAQGFAVTTAGDLVAIHCYTAKGTVVVTGPLVAFNGSARAERDANGRPFEAKVSNRAVLEADAARARASVPVALPDESSAYTPPSPTGKITRTRMTPERQARIDEAARRIIANPGLRRASVAREIGEPEHHLYAALRRLRLQARPPVAKPNGKIL